MTNFRKMFRLIKSALIFAVVSGFMQPATAAPLPPVLLCNSAACESNSTGGFDLSAYNIPFGISWPTAPTITSNAIVTPGTLASNNVSGRRLVLAAGNYGDVTISNDDQEWVLQVGANIDTLYYSSSANRIVVKGETPRAGLIGNINSSSSGGATDILFDGIYQINNASTPQYYDNNRWYGTRVAIINSSLNTHGYVQAGFSTAPNAINNFIFAGNYARSDSGISVPHPSSESLFRMIGPNQFVIVGNYFDKVTGGLGVRIHADQQDSTDGYIADNVIVGSRSSTTYNAIFVARSGGDSPARNMRDIVIEDNLVYNPNGGAILTTSTPAQSPEASGMTLRNNTSYSAGGWPSSQAGWVITGNVSNGYQSPPTSDSKVGF